MAGHSKWANIKHRKGAQDAKRAKVFAKLSKEITVAALAGIPDPSMNPALRLAITKAKATSMPKKNIEAAVAKASGNKNGDSFQELSYGANVYGVSFLITCLTDNTNRTASSIQYIVSRSGGSLSGASAVLYVFDRKGVLEFAKSHITEDEAMMLVLESGAIDFEASDTTYIAYTDPSSFSNVKDKLEQASINEFITAEVKYLPNQEVKTPKDKAEKILTFIDKLEDDDDVQDVFHNLDADSLD